MATAHPLPQPLPVLSRRLRLRRIEVADAAYVLALRSDPDRTQHLSAVAPDLAAQECWIRAYQAREAAGQEAYLIAMDPVGRALGTVRLYDYRGPSFCWGSWILQPEAPTWAGIETALSIYGLGFDCLGFTRSHFSVRRNNHKVIRFHQRFGARCVGEDADELHFEIRTEDVAQARQRYVRYLPPVAAASVVAVSSA